MAVRIIPRILKTLNYCLSEVKIFLFSSVIERQLQFVVPTDIMKLLSNINYDILLFKIGNDFQNKENLKRKKDDTGMVDELETFLSSEAASESFAIKENEKLLESSGKQLLSLLKRSEEKEMTSFQCLLVEKFSEIPEENQIDVFNKLMDIMDEEISK